MINGLHVLLTSQDPAADRAFLRDVLGWPFVEDAGSEPGWLIFKAPPTEIGVHPTDGVPAAQPYLMCDDIDATIAELASKGVEVTSIREAGFGRVVQVIMPSGARLGLYQPHHPVALDL